MSTDLIYQAIRRVVTTRLGEAATRPGLTVLDIGVGRGRLLELLCRDMRATACGCDLDPDRLERGTVPVTQVNLNSHDLPYPSEAFDLVTCSEVLEHLENYHRLLREAYRVLKPRGLVVVSTPNVLNVKSRLRYWAGGFPNLFGPLPLTSDRCYSVSGHITPLPLFYLARVLRALGFTALAVDIDKVQRTSLVCLVLFYPLWRIAWECFLVWERQKYRTLTPENEPLVRWHGTTKVLTGRTLIVSAWKSPEAPCNGVRYAEGQERRA